MSGGLIALFVIIGIMLMVYLVISMVFKTFNPVNLAKMAFGGVKSAGNAAVDAGESAGKGIAGAGKSVGKSIGL